MVKIYIQNKPLFLVDSINSEIEDYLHRPNTIFIDELSPAAVKTMLYEMEQPEFYYGVFKHNDVEALLQAFKSHLLVVKAAGGLVYTNEQESLLIHRLGHWDLPKGKLDEGETLEECALREIKEETGADNLQVEKPLLITYHTYRQDGKHILKESHWYLVKTTQKTALTPQTNENIAQAIWVPLQEIALYIGGAYASVADVLRLGATLLQHTTK
ncbi:MAG: NUDIX domain-containing protein [Bacteroidota bacterium]|nr:NUDIX domain-containing protein [Bacteroidota bacterium]